MYVVELLAEFLERQGEATARVPEGTGRWGVCVRLPRPTTAAIAAAAGITSTAIEPERGVGGPTVAAPRLWAH